jgi:hypothetical protein
MKYVCPAVALSVTTEPWWSFGSPVPHPGVSSLQPTSVPLQVPLRTYITVS